MLAPLAFSPFTTVRRSLATVWVQLLFAPQSDLLLTTVGRASASVSPEEGSTLLPKLFLQHYQFPRACSELSGSSPDGITLIEARRRAQQQPIF